VSLSKKVDLSEYKSEHKLSSNQKAVFVQKQLPNLEKALGIVFRSPGKIENVNFRRENLQAYCQGQVGEVLFFQSKEATIIFSSELSSELLNRSFGGSKMGPTKMNFTDLEKKMLHSITSVFFDALKECFQLDSPIFHLEKPKRISELLF
jgi:hypothetical protein